MSSAGIRPAARRTRSGASILGLACVTLLMLGLVTEGPPPHVQQVKPAAAVTLDAGHLAGSFPVDPETVLAAPPVLSLSVTRVVNPAAQPFTLVVYLTSAGEGGEAVKIRVGTVSLYPADRPAGFLLRTSSAFADLRRQRHATRPQSVRLLIELQPIHAGTAPGNLEVTVAAPRWTALPEP
jgi:hypothetical protein